MALIEYILVLAGLIPAAVSDRNKGEIPDWASLPVLASAAVRLIWDADNTDRIATGALFIVLLIAFVIITLRKYDALGGGDMKLLLALSLAFPPRSFAGGLVIACAAALIYGHIKGEKRLRLAPFFLIGFGLVGLVRVIVMLAVKGLIIC